MSDDRRSFFGTHLDREALEVDASSSSADSRWLAALQLSQVHEPWSADILWRLRDDDDESTRLAARNALRAFPKELLANRSTEATDKVDASVSVWKARPLPTLVSGTKDLYLAAIVDLLNAEGPSTGGRVFRMLTACAQATASKPPGRAQVKQLLDELHSANTISRVDEHLESSQIDTWIVTPHGWPEYVIRPRNGRDLRDIPITEARAVLRNDRRFMRDTTKTDLGFRALRQQYEIADNEFHVVGETLENQWLGLFKNL